MIMIWLAEEKTRSQRRENDDCGGGAGVGLKALRVKRSGSALLLVYNHRVPLGCGEDHHVEDIHMGRRVDHIVDSVGNILGAQGRISLVHGLGSLGVSVETDFREFRLNQPWVHAGNTYPGSGQGPC